MYTAEEITDLMVHTGSALEIHSNTLKNLFYEKKCYFGSILIGLINVYP